MFVDNNKDLKVIIMMFIFYHDKRLQTHDKVTTYPYETNAFKICENEMLL